MFINWNTILKYTNKIFKLSAWQKLNLYLWYWLFDLSTSRSNELRIKTLSSVQLYLFFRSSFSKFPLFHLIQFGATRVLKSLFKYWTLRSHDLFLLNCWTFNALLWCQLNTFSQLFYAMKCNKILSSFNHEYTRHKNDRDVSFYVLVISIRLTCFTCSR